MCGSGAEERERFLARFRLEVVEPVVASLITSDELGSIRTYWGDHGGRAVVVIRVTVKAEVLEVVVDPWLDDGGRDPALLASEIAEVLEDRLPTTDFAWGQWRSSPFTLP